MDFMKVLKEDAALAELVSTICDVELTSGLRAPQDEDGHLEYNIPGQTFARDGSGSEFILLEDKSIGFWGSEGQGGRIADSMADFFELMVNCPFWIDYMWADPYDDMDALRRYAEGLHEEHAEMVAEDMQIDLEACQRELAEKLGITLYEDVAESVLMKLYRCANREPRLISTYTENDGSRHSNSGSLFEG